RCDSIRGESRRLACELSGGFLSPGDPLQALAKHSTSRLAGVISPKPVSGPHARSPSRRTIEVDSRGVPSSSAQVGDDAYLHRLQWRVYAGTRETLEVFLADRLHLGWRRSHAKEL